LDDKTLVIAIGDVSGKGISAAMFMVLAKNLLKYEITSLKKNESLANAIARTNEQLAKDNSASMFVTCFAAKIDIETGEVEYCNAGHNPPLVIEPDSDAKELVSSTEISLPLGVLVSASYSSSTFALQKGGAILLYTDGVTEAFNMEREQFGMSRLLESMGNFSKNSTLNPDAIVTYLLSEVEDFAGNEVQSDDITALFFKRAPKTTVQRIKIAPELQKFKLIRELFTAEMLSNKFSNANITQTTLAFEELFVNAVNYSNATKIEVEFFVDAGDFTLRLIDDGKQFDPAATSTPNLVSSVTDRKIGGLGIFMASNLVDKLDYTYVDGKNIVTLVKRRG
jgi:sigma-B regulation protein RsbU (phosphoserine phosphatase)